MAEDLDETLPAESVDLAVREYFPSSSEDVTVIEKIPFELAVSLPKIIDPLKRVTLEPGSALPVIVGVESLVIEEEVAKEVGASGAVASIVMDMAEDLDETLPAESVAVAFIEY